MLIDKNIFSASKNIYHKFVLQLSTIDFRLRTIHSLCKIFQKVQFSCEHLFQKSIGSFKVVLVNNESTSQEIYF